MRLKFGPKFSPVRLARPAVAGELPDPEVTADLGDVTPGPNGTVGVPVIFHVPAYTPGVDGNHLVAVYAVGVAGSTAEPTDPAEAIKLPLQASADASGHTAGGDLVVNLDGLPVGPVILLTVFGFEDPEPAPAEAAAEPSAS